MEPEVASVMSASLNVVGEFRHRMLATDIETMTER